jgi:hypothetical protein
VSAAILTVIGAFSKAFSPGKGGVKVDIRKYFIFNTAKETEVVTTPIPSFKGSVASKIKVHFITR